MNHAFRPLRFGAFVLAAASLLLLAACQEDGAAVGPPTGGDPVAVTLHPMDLAAEISAQGRVSGARVHGVPVTVFDETAGGPVSFASDGSIDPDGSPTLQLWDRDAQAVVPTTIYLTEGHVYALDLDVLGTEEPLEPVFPVTAIASETTPPLTEGITLGFSNLTSVLEGVLLDEYDRSDPTLCESDPSASTNDRTIDSGGPLALYLTVTAPGLSTNRDCVEGTFQTAENRVPLTDFEIVPGSVETLGVEVLVLSKRGVVVVHDGATPEAGVAITIEGVDEAGNLQQFDQTVPLTVLDPPAPTGLDPDLTPPVIEAATLIEETRTVVLEIGPTSDPADVAGVAAFYGVAELDLRPVVAAPNASGENTVTYEALICSDAFISDGIVGTNTKEPEIVFFASDPTGNQSEPFRLPYIINGIFDEPLPECDF